MEVEEFVRNGLLEVINDIADDDKISFFGMWQRRPERFCFLKGERVLISGIADAVRNMLSMCGHLRFKLNEKLIKNDVKKMIILSSGRYFASRVVGEGIAKHNKTQAKPSPQRRKKKVKLPDLLHQKALNNMRTFGISNIIDQLEQHRTLSFLNAIALWIDIPYTIIALFVDLALSYYI